MIARGQRVHGGRATFATLMGPCSLFVFVCGGYLLLMYALTAPLLARMQQQQIQQQQQQPELETPQKERIIE
jgi:hypothetical protein